MPEAGLSLAAHLMIVSLVFVAVNLIRGIAGRKLLIETVLMSVAFGADIAYENPEGDHSR
ncbi:MAG TPA: hypothetical protein VNM92_17555 [Thermoanaerobaculia bacterium]|nr:hypothetical protein [Thermoanaerobaculia bacterium]